MGQKDSSSAQFFNYLVKKNLKKRQKKARKGKTIGTGKSKGKKVGGKRKGRKTGGKKKKRGGSKCIKQQKGGKKRKKTPKKNTINQDFLVPVASSPVGVGIPPPTNRTLASIVKSKAQSVGYLPASSLSIYQKNLQK